MIKPAHPLFFPAHFISFSNPSSFTFFMHSACDGCCAGTYANEFDNVACCPTHREENLASGVCDLSCTTGSNGKLCQNLGVPTGT